jgi:hypothetical protein
LVGNLDYGAEGSYDINSKEKEGTEKTKTAKREKKLRENKRIEDRQTDRQTFFSIPG